MTRTRRLTWTAVALVIVAAVVAFVVIRNMTPTPEAPVLATQAGFAPGATVECLVHQTEEPNALYRGGDTSNAEPQLTFLAYYTAAGAKPFCDGQPATDTDRIWAQLYVQLTTSRQNVTSVLPAD